MKKKFEHNCIIYTRVSTEEQVSNFSLDNQEKACLEYANRKGFRCKKVFREEGISAKTLKRPKLNDAIGFCGDKKNKIRYLLVWKFDRIARDIGVHVAIRGEFARRGIEVIAVEEPTDDSPSGRLLETIIAGFAQFDNENRAEKAKIGMKASFEAGNWLWRAPIGLKVVKDENGKNPQLVPGVDYVKIHKLFRKTIDNNLSLTDAHEYALKLGIKPIRSKELSLQAADDFLRNPLYAGIQKSSMSERVIYKAYGVISVNEHYELINRLDGKSRGKSKKNLILDFRYDNGLSVQIVDTQ